MEILRQQAGDVLEVRVKGRLDGYWADHLSTELADTIRNGARKIRLNMADVKYMSSAGIRVLVQVYQQLRSIQGSFAVASPSEAVKSVLEMAGLRQLLVTTEVVSPTAAAAPVPAARLERESIRFEIFDVSPQAGMTCRVIGNPELLAGCRFRQEHCCKVPFPDAAFGIGLGAFGNDFDDCRGRFGEFLAVAGTAVYLPTDGTNVADYMLKAGDLIPEVKVLYGIAGEGAFPKVAYFEQKDGAVRPMLSDIVSACLDIAGTDSVAMAMVAESAGLVGVVLKRSPALEAAATAPFGHPGIREWLSLTSERAYPRSLALVVGVAGRGESKTLAPFLRRIGKNDCPVGHFHAAAFSYRPLKKGEVDLRKTVHTLFESETLQGVLHLMYDDREPAGVGQSEFLRGACWLSPIRESQAK